MPAAQQYEWADGATRQLEVAEEEGMTGSQPDLFAGIRAALHALGYWPDPEKSAPTKRGG